MLPAGRDHGPCRSSIFTRSQRKMPLQKPRRIAGFILTTLCFSYAFFGSAEAEPIPCNNPLAASSQAAAKANLEAREVEAIRGVYGTRTDCAWSAEQISALLATL